MKRVKRINRRQAPGPDYQFTLDDLQRMVEQLGGRFMCSIYPKEFDEPRKEPESVVAVDPHVEDSGPTPTRV